MQVTYTLEPADVTQYEKFYAARRQKGLTASRIIRIVIPIAVLLVIIYSVASSSHSGTPAGRTSLLDLLISVFLPLLIIICFWAFVLRNARRKPSSVLFSKPHTLKIHPDNLQQQHEGIESTIQWSRVYDIVSDERSLYFFTEEVIAYIVPRRAFPSPNLAETFLATAVAYWKGKAAPVSSTDVWPPAPEAGAVLKGERHDDK